VCLKQAISVIAEDYMYISFYENRVLATFSALHCMSNLETGGFLKEEIDSQSPQWISGDCFVLEFSKTTLRPSDSPVTHKTEK
jgi:hypothetical protein